MLSNFTVGSSSKGKQAQQAGNVPTALGWAVQGPSSPTASL